MVYLLPAILIATAIGAAIFMYQGAFRVEPTDNELAMKTRRVGRLTVDVPELADQIGHWHCTLVVDQKRSLLWLEEILIDRLAEAEDKSGRLEWELDVLVHKEKNLHSNLQWKEIDLGDQFGRPARFIIGRGLANNSWNFDWEVLNFNFWLGFPNGVLKISGLPQLIQHEKLKPGEAEQELASGETRFMTWVRKALDHYHWLGGPDEPGPPHAFRTLAGYFDGELSRAPWNVSASFKSTSPPLSFWAECEHEPDPYPDMFKEEALTENRLAFLLSRVFRGFFGDSRGRPGRNSFKNIRVEGVSGLEYITFEYDANERPCLNCRWKAAGRRTAGRPRIILSVGTDPHGVHHPIEEDDIPAVLGVWRAMLHSVRWPRN